MCPRGRCEWSLAEKSKRVERSPRSSRRMTEGGSLPRAARQKAEVRIKPPQARPGGMEEGSEPDLPRERPWRNAAHRADLAFQPFSSVSVRSVQSAVKMTLSIGVFQSASSRFRIFLASGSLIVVSWNCFYNSILRIHPD